MKTLAQTWTHDSLFNPVYFVSVKPEYAGQWQSVYERGAPSRKSHTVRLHLAH